MIGFQQLVQEIAIGAGGLLLYVVVLAVPAFLVRRFTRIGDESFRKLLHMIAVVALMFWPFMYEHWYAAVFTALVFIAVLYPALALLGRHEGFTRFVNEREAGEFKTSMVLVLVMYVIVLAVCWGWYGERAIAVAAIAAWGFGDAAAALVGKRFGKRVIGGRFIEGRKSFEGSAAMLAVSFVSVLVVLASRGGMAWHGLVLTSLAAALVSTVAELVSRRGFDTLACPLSAMAVMLPMVWLFGGACS